jgi:ribosomal protein S18 acetylase RimI-like enzyme
VVRAIRERDVLDAAKVFRESFSGSPDEKPRSFVLRYLLEACVAEDEEDDEEEKSDDASAQMKKSRSGGNAASNPYEVCFVGVTTKTNPETQEVTEDEVISLVSVALDVRSRIADDPNPPPSDAPYVCNMAVASEHRNKGVAKAMLEAIGEFVPSVGGCDVWLHVREVDGKAARVYERFGFETVKVDEKNPLLNLVMNRKESRKGRALMRKVLAEGCNFIV